MLITSLLISLYQIIGMRCIVLLYAVVLTSSMHLRLKYPFSRLNKFKYQLFSSTKSIDVVDISKNDTLAIPEHYRTLGHQDFIKGRDWSLVARYWELLIKNKVDIPRFILGNNEHSQYGITNLKAIENIGYDSEFKSKDTLYSLRKTYAIRLGYVGTYYYGYQTQNKANESIVTIEDEIMTALGKIGHAAGRTDRNVSAISQIICVTYKKDINSDDILEKLNSLPSSQSGILRAYECARVPRKFNARARAIWRRYIYLFPLNSLDEMDFEFINKVLLK